jgi:hypothetical protein
MAQSRGLAGLNKFLEGEDTTYLAKRTDAFDMSMTNPWRKDRPAVVVYPRVETFYQHDSDIESVETQSIMSEDEGGVEFAELYRITGLVWHTPGLTNTCNVDSFLSFWVRRVLQTHGRAADFITTTDLAGNALIKIADKALLAHGEGEGLDAKDIKLVWYRAVLTASGESHLLESEVEDKTLDCMGINTCSVFQHLKNHSSYATESKCKCGTVFNRDFFLEIPNMAEIRYLTEKQEYHKARTPKCLACGQKRVLIDLVSDPNNWILPIAWMGTGDNKSPSLKTVPKFITFGGINYKIGYISYSQTVPGMPNMTHEVSIQNIRGGWYFYDGIEDAKFRKFDLDVYTYARARMSSLVYIKVDTSDVGGASNQ